MNVYRVTFKPSAQRELPKLPRHVQAPIMTAVRALAEAPRPVGCRKLSGAEGIWRIRVGQYRVLYAIDDAERVVHILRAGDRRDVYR